MLRFFTTILAVSCVTGVCGNAAELGVPCDEPILSVKLCGVDRLETTVNYVLQQTDAKIGGLSLDSFRVGSSSIEGVGTQDLQRPSLLLVYLRPNMEGVRTREDAMPRVTVIPALKVAPTLEPVSPGIYCVNQREQMFARPANRWVYVSKEQALLERELPDPEDLLRQHSAEHDLSVIGDLTHVPDFWKSLALRVLGGMRDHLLRAYRRTDQYKQSRQILLAHTLATALIHESRDVWLGLAVSPQTGRIKLDVRLRGMPNSSLAQSLQRSTGASTRFPRLAQPDAALNVACRLKLTGAAQELLKWTDPEFAPTLPPGLDADQREQLGPGIREVAGVSEIVLNALLDHGLIDFAVRVEEGERDNFLLAVCAPGISHLEPPLQRVCKQLHDLGITDFLELHVERHGKRGIYRFCKGKDYYFACGDSTLHVGRGPNAVDHLKSALAGGQNVDSPPERLPAILVQGDTGQLGRLLTAAAQFWMRSQAPRVSLPEGGRFRLAVDSVPDGMQLSFDADVAVLRGAISVGNRASERR